MIKNEKKIGGTFPGSLSKMYIESFSFKFIYFSYEFNKYKTNKTNE